jgi:hypothetical protein
MRSATSWREICAGVVFLVSMTLATEGALAVPQVVADEACAYHEIDIASFATCVEGHVARLDEELQTADQHLVQHRE